MVLALARAIVCVTSKDDRSTGDSGNIDLSQKS
jgi:hypothetical protein